MTKKNFLFLKEIVSSDFSIVKTKLKPSRIHGAKLALKTRKFGVFTSLNLFNFNKNFKLFIRILFFTFTRKQNTKFYIENDYLCSLFKMLLKRAKITKLFSVEPSLINVNKGYSIKHAVLLDDIFSKSSVINTLIHNNILLISKFNNIHENRMQGSYKNFNELSELKKILFFFVVIKKTTEYKKKISHLNKTEIKPEDAAKKLAESRERFNKFYKKSWGIKKAKQ